MMILLPCVFPSYAQRHTYTLIQTKTCSGCCKITVYTVTVCVGTLKKYHGGYKHPGNVHVVKTHKYHTHTHTISPLPVQQQPVCSGLHGGASGGAIAGALAVFVNEKRSSHMDPLSLLTRALILSQNPAPRPPELLMQLQNKTPS